MDAVASLLLIIALGGYENFVSKIGVSDHEDRPAWMGKVGFSDLKIKLMGAMVAISAIELLKAFINVDTMSNTQLAWRAGIHLVFRDIRGPVRGDRPHCRGKRRIALINSRRGIELKQNIRST